MMLSEQIKESMLPDQTCQRLTLAQVQLATNNFDQALVIGRGGFGLVYKSLSNFRSSINEVAIKRLNSSSSQGANEFEAEVKILSKLRHGNLVPLIGYCSEGKEMVLAYEFMPNGTLEKHLKRGDTELSWLQRLKICIGAARGLDYLHTGTSTRHGVIHRDVKTSNILLDSNFDAKISDFGLAKVGAINQTQTHVSTLVKGTFGYMDPCYFYSGNLTRKSDVYAFGVVLFEVLSGKQAVDPTLDEDQWGLAVWAQDHFKAGKLNEIIDHRLIGQVSKKSLKEFASIAVLCLHSHPKQRPTMAEVVVKLESILSRDSESAGSGADDGRFFNKVRYLLTGKADLMLAHAEGSKSETSAQYIQKTSNISLRVFTYAELVSATEKCNDKGFSTNIETSYKGWVDELTYAPTKPGVGLAIYVWTRHIGANMPDLNSEQFNHPNLAKLVGYYLNEHKLSCVSERRPSLDKILFGEPGITPLSWDARLKIALGTAQGLSFLHKKGHPAYREFTITCITVDADYNARLQDFEMSRPWTFYGNRSYYAAPEGFDYDLDVLDGVEFCRDGSLLKGEIYSFGVVLLEILTGMKVFDPNRPKGKQHLVAQPKGKQDLVAQFQDNNNHPPKEAFMLAELVLNCLQPVRDERPLTEKILRVLRQCYHETMTAKRKTNNES